MTNPNQITDKIVLKAWIAALHVAKGTDLNNPESIKSAILAIQDDITLPLYNLLRGWKQDAEAYKRALECIRDLGSEISAEIADSALRGDYHKTDFTEFCETKEESYGKNN